MILSVLTRHSSPSDPQTLPMSASTSHQTIPFPCHFSIQTIHLLHRPPSTTQKTPCPLSELSHLATNHNQSLKFPKNICRLFGCRLVGHCIAYEWAIHTTNTELLSAEHFPNTVKTLSKRHQNPLETPPNHPRNAIKPSSKRHQNPPPNSTHIFP